MSGAPFLEKRSLGADCALPSSFVRNLGGSVGLALSGTIILNTVRSTLEGTLDETLIRAKIEDPTSQSLSTEQNEVFRKAYQHGFRNVFLVLASLAAFAFAVAFVLMPQRTVDREDDEQQKKEALERLEKR